MTSSQRNYLMEVGSAVNVSLLILEHKRKRDYEEEKEQVSMNDKLESKLITLSVLQGKVREIFDRTDKHG